LHKNVTGVFKLGNRPILVEKYTKIAPKVKGQGQMSIMSPKYNDF